MAASGDLARCQDALAALERELEAFSAAAAKLTEEATTRTNLSLTHS